MKGEEQELSRDMYSLRIFQGYECRCRKEKSDVYLLALPVVDFNYRFLHYN